MKCGEDRVITIFHQVFKNPNKNHILLGKIKRDLFMVYYTEFLKLFNKQFFEFTFFKRDF